MFGDVKVLVVVIYNFVIGVLWVVVGFGVLYVYVVEFWVIGGDGVLYLFGLLLGYQILLLLMYVDCGCIIFGLMFVILVELVGGLLIGLLIGLVVVVGVVVCV